ncbi:phospholipase D-like domain-containing protein [Crocosphaera sp. UHCC 0190]|uniref:phospholipase D-like domain-containing protein n=1 Tax=Crocosphaera sp. UHCC 0190 TaxID=3110246 RepID=UPI002B1FD58C|nr:phospholipase D-like domain-containing protein [Crocosphaera sp. UHCC 0190]MEA5508957.1 phospholipase D-like domain-containing protein [Crocosphaera sp. UHCC 0190]
MATISFNDREKIKKFITPPPTDKGYVLNFSNNNFQEFIGSATELNIYEEGKYDNLGTSKANRLRSFLEKEPNAIAGKVLLKLVEYQKTLNPIYHSSEIKPDEIVEIANKLLQDSIDEEGDASGTVYFEKIRENILNELKQAEFTIWIAVAWFTDPCLFKCLIMKKLKGLNIQVIINDDQINNSSDLDYNQFETYKLPPLGVYSKNKMHHKFCIIDFKTVIHGSYNWTKAARYNGETIEISTGYEKAKQFSQEFMKLKLEGMN